MAHRKVGKKHRKVERSIELKHKLGSGDLSLTWITKDAMPPRSMMKIMKDMLLNSPFIAISSCKHEDCVFYLISKSTESS